MRMAKGVNEVGVAQKSFNVSSARRRLVSIHSNVSRNPVKVGIHDAVKVTADKNEVILCELIDELIKNMREKIDV